MRTVFRLLLSLGIVGLVVANLMTVRGSGPAVTAVLTTVLTAGHGPSQAAPGGGGGGAPAAAGPSAPAATTVTIGDYTFTPAELTVPAGATVTVTNQDPTVQILTADDGSFGTGEIPAQQSGTFTAPTKPGTYPFRSGVLSFMTGTLTVT